MAAQGPVYLYNDMSTLANYTAWATLVSGWIAGAGWTQYPGVTGQVMWTGMNLTAVSKTGSNATYTYNTLTGMPLQNGRLLTITSMTNSANNGNFVITAFTGTTSGTFTVVNAAAVNESGSTGVVTKVSTLPGNGGTSGNFRDYEVWLPGDSLTPYYLKMQYGSWNSSNSPSMTVEIGTTINSAGTFYGYTNTSGNSQNGATWCGPFPTMASGNTTYVGGTTLPFPCYFSGDAGRLMIFLWRSTSYSNSIYCAPQVISIERSVNASGVYTGSHVTLITIGCNDNINGALTPVNQQSLHFTYGAVCPQSTRNYDGGGLSVFMPYLSLQNSNNTVVNSLINMTTNIDFVRPFVGNYDYPLTQLGMTNSWALYDGQLLTQTVYGTSHTYLVSVGSFPLGWAGPRHSVGALCMRWD